MNYVRARVRGSGWMPLVTLMLVLYAPGPFADLRAAWFGSNYSVAIEILRFGVVLPSTLMIATITYTSLYQRFYPIAAQIVAPLNAACFIAMDVMMRPQGYSLSTWLVLVILGSYFMYGMLLHQGIRSALTILCVYAVMGMAAGLNSPQWRMDLAAITFAATFAGYVYYSLHRAVRANWLNNRQMSDHLNRDALTGIHNRRMFDEQIERLWQQAMRERASLGLLIVDIDHFKSYNDSLGHQAGDQCLANIAFVLAKGARRPLDVAARYGGEEFAVLLYRADRQSMEELAEQLRSQVAAAGWMHPASPVNPFVTVSIGGACVTPREGRSAFGFIQLADEALYAAKERGRNRSVIMDQEYDSLRTGVFRSFKPQKEIAA
ncbi:MAG TPA: diguanylate cyclase [Steroidobacteraceae bacterium]|nr:diguanylate cyclase [Steroidobacteraceae bacterium]